MQAALDVVGPEQRDAAGVAIRQRPKHHGVDGREHRGVRADAEGEGKDYRNRDGGAASQASGGIANILREGFELRFPARGAHGLLRLLEAAHFDPRRALGVVAGESGAGLLADG
jgi:hypothetical protein